MPNKGSLLINLDSQLVAAPFNGGGTAEGLPRSPFYEDTAAIHDDSNLMA